MSTTGPVPQVRAAGGVAWRDRTGRREFVVVHRPRYDDWSLPKGKAHRRESDEEAALREVEEETGLRCVLGPELPTVRYVLANGAEKTVRWWAMTVAEDLGFNPGDEVDELRWVDRDEFGAIASFGSDLSVLDAFLAT